MYKKPAIIIMLFFTFFQNVSAQSFLESMQRRNDLTEFTLFDYKQAFDDYWAPYEVINGYYTDKDGVKQKAANWKQFNRWFYYMEKRVNPKTGKFPNTSSAEQYSLWLKANPQNSNVNQGIMSGPLYASSWTSVGPNNSGGGYSGTGRLNCVEFHPTDNNTFWVGSPSGGLWVTSNGGTNWIPLTDNNSTLGVSDIGIPGDYATSSTIYIATGDRDGGSMWSLGGGQANDNNSIGVLKSTDGGSTWSLTGLTYNTSDRKILSKIIVHPTTYSTLYVAGTDGILKSSDGGANWTNIYNTKVVYDIKFKPGDPTTLYASTKDYSGTPLILVSTNGGANWTNANVGSASTALAISDSRIELAVSSANNAYVYAVVTTTGGGLKGIYKSTDSGSNYSQVYDGTATNQNLLSGYTDGSGGTSGQGNYDIALAVSNSNIDEVYVAGVITHKSTNGGTSWSAVNCWTPYSVYNKNSAPVVHADHHMLKFRPSDGALFEANDGGIYSTTNNGSSWNHLTGDLVISQLYRLSVSQTTAGESIAGLQDNGTKMYSSGIWTDVKGGDGMDCQIDQTTANTQYGAYVYGQITRTTDHWSTSTDIEPSSAGNGWWMTPYVIDPNNHNILYAGYADLYKTIDQGNNWTSISSINTTNVYGTGDIRAIAVAPSNSNYIYISDQDQIWVTANAGSLWTDVTGSLPVSSNSITNIAVKNDDPSTVWVTFGGYDTHRIYESIDAGTSWTNISSGLPNIPVMCVIENKLNSSATELYIGTDVGIYLKTGNANWVSYNTSLPNVVVNDLDIYYDSSTPSNSRLYAGTSGRGVWTTPLNSTGCTPPSIQASNFSSSNLATTAMDISWARGNGNKVIILAHENASVDSDPSSGNTYTANAAFGSGDQIGIGNYVVYNGTGTSASLTNMTSGATMHYALYEYNTSDNCYITPSYTGSATTLGSPSVSTTASSSISATGATSGGDVSSTNGSSLIHKGVCWSTSNSPTIVDSHTDDIASGTGIGSYASSITGLSASTTYYVRAYAENSSGISYGNEESFATSCGLVSSFPYTENFDSWTTSFPAYSCTDDGSVSFEDCWSNITGDDLDWDIHTGATGTGSTGPTTDYSGTGNYVYVETSSCYFKTAYITTTSFDFSSLTNPQLSFYFHMYGADMGTLSIQASTDGGITWSSDLWSLSGDQGDSWQKVDVSLAVYNASTNVTMRFTAISGSSYVSDMAIDEFKIKEGPTCTDPSLQAESNITASTVDLDWTEHGTATTWQIEYGYTGFTQGSGTIISTSSKPYTLSNLSGSLSYDWYVRSDCGSGDYSMWVGSSDFTTSCGTITTFPYVESFENTICWQQSDLTNTDGEWSINTGTVHPSGIAAQDGSKLAYFNSFTSSAGSQTVLISPEIDISSLNKPMLSYWLYHETGKSSNDDRIQPGVIYNSTIYSAGSSVSRYDGTTGWVRYTVDLSDPSYPSIIQIGFLATSEYGNDIHIDNIKVFEGESITTGKLTKCSPYFIRDGADGSLYFYDDFTFSVDVSGDYDIIADWTINTSFDGYLYLYSPSFDPDNPLQNLIASNDDFNGEDDSKFDGQSLNASTNYVLVATTYDNNNIGSNFTISIIGSSIITAPTITIRNGKANSMAHSVAVSDATSRISDYECADINNWSHYYYDNGTPEYYLDDKILLSVLKNSNDLGATTVTIDGSLGASFIDPLNSPYVNTFDGWYVFNRYWNLIASNQPLSDVSVRFYYTDDDFTILNTALSNSERTTIAEHSDMSFVKINDLNSSNYDADPANGHLNIPKASTYETDGAWIYKNSSQATTNRWAHGTFAGAHYAEFIVNHFSGGGGGAAGNINEGSLPIELLSFNAFAKNNVNEIVWKTASEINVDYFDVIRKNNIESNGIIISSIKASGNSNTIKSYSIDDVSPINEAYYRLKSVDFDGAMQYSDWVFVKRDGDNLKIINLYPNPANNNVSLHFYNPTSSITNIIVRDILGGEIRRIKVNVENGYQNIDIDISDLSLGTYFILIENNDSRDMEMLIKK